MQKNVNKVALCAVIASLYLPHLLASEKSLSTKIQEGYETFKEKSVELKTNVKNELDKNKDRREKRSWGIHFDYAYIDTWVPSKTGATVYYIENQQNTWDLEYLKGSLGVPSFIIDIGELSDTRLSFLKRSYRNRTSFHYLYGIYYNNINIHLGDEFVEDLTGDSRFSADLIDIKVMGVSWGIGNRWTTSGKFTWGVDWFSVNWPLVKLGSDTPYLDESDDKSHKEDVRDVIEFIEKYPTFSLLIIQLGISW